MLDVFPGPAKTDHGNVALCDSIYFCDGGSRYSLCKEFSNMENIFFRNPCKVILFSLCETFLTNSILAIFSISTKKQMTRTYAGGVIAFVADNHGLGYGTKVNYPRCAMGGVIYLVFANGCNLPITIRASAFILMACPYPAFRSFLYKFPESFSKRFVSARARVGAFWTTKSSTSIQGCEFALAA